MSGIFAVRPCQVRALQIIIAAAGFLALICDGRAFAQEEAPLPPRLEKAAVQRVKKATVLMQVTTADGDKAEGSGFFALKPGIVITNAHVVGMLAKQSKPPRDLVVVVNSGEANESKLKGTVIDVDLDRQAGNPLKIPAPK